MRFALLRRLVVPVAALGLAGGAAGAAAHPFGPPQTVEVDATGDTVRVWWSTGAPDDVTMLASGLGLLPSDRYFLDGGFFPEDDDAELLAAAPQFADYLLGHLAVSVDGAACVGELTDASQLAERGALVEFRCPVVVREAELTVTTLLDLSPYYKTFATGPDGQRATYDDDHRSHSWTFPVDGTDEADGATRAEDSPGGNDLGRSAAIQLSAVGGTAVAVAGFAAAVLRRRRR